MGKVREIMDKDTKQMFTRRITHANGTQLIVILYEMLLVYLEDAQTAYRQGDSEEFCRNLQTARGCIGELRESLNFEYEISKNLFSIYCFADRTLAGDIFGNRAAHTHINALRGIFTKLHDAFDTVSKTDTSPPLMDNIQDVYAGITYGRTDINENLANYDAERGFRV
ncbi:MAG: flagellar protein FliS [Roseburia sp.]|nr:flagellar protein FliS [Roseburia sp.]